MSTGIASAAASSAAAPAPGATPAGSPAVADCRQNPGPALDWAEARRRLLDCNRDIGLARQGVAAARADITIAGQRPNPTFGVGGASISPSAGIGAGGLLDKQIDYTARLDQLVERGGKRGYRIDAADQAWRAANWRAADTVRDTELELARAWIDLWGAQERVDLQQELAGLYAKTVDGARRRLKAGDISAADVARIELEAERAAAERVVVEGERLTASNVVAALLALSPRAAPVEAVDPWPSSLSADADPAARPETGSATALRPDLLAARAEVAAAGARAKLARSLQTRDVTVGVQSERYARPAGNGWSFGLFASVPLFVNNNSEGEIARAEADEAETELAATRLEQQALADRRRLLDARATARANRDRLERLALPLAQRVAHDADVGFRKGNGTVLDLLDSLRQLRALQLDTLAARLDEDRSDAELRAGMLLPDSARDPVFGVTVDGFPDRPGPR